LKSNWDTHKSVEGCSEKFCVDDLLRYGVNVVPAAHTLQHLDLDWHVTGQPLHAPILHDQRWNTKTHGKGQLTRHWATAPCTHSTRPKAKHMVKGNWHVTGQRLLRSKCRSLQRTTRWCCILGPHYIELFIVLCYFYNSRYFQSSWSFNKRAQRALDRSPEEKVIGHSGAYRGPLMLSTKYW